MHISTLSTPELGNRSYVVDDGALSVVIDPQRDLDRLEPLLEHSPAYVLETHVHNDYVTGGVELARRTGATYGVNAADEVSFERLPVTDGQVLRAGSLAVTALATPGHTPTHLSYMVEDLADPASAPAVFSGGSLLYGTVGRTDLVSARLTRSLATEQVGSARRLAGLPGTTRLFPTHGFGSFCSSGGGTDADASTIADEREKNLALAAEPLETVVERLVASFGPYPAYYPHMSSLNRQGPGQTRLDSALRRTSATELRRLLGSDTVVVDLRDAADFAGEHLAGTLSIAHGQSFATYVGWLTPWGGPLAVLGERVEQLEEARRQLTRIGIDSFTSIWGPWPDLAAAAGPTRSYRRTGFDELAAEGTTDDVVVDVRRSEEYDADHVRDARHLPVHELEGRVTELPTGRRTWVYCAGGFRAGTAASILDRHGFEVVHVDDTFDRAISLGLTGP